MPTRKTTRKRTSPAAKASGAKKKNSTGRRLSTRGWLIIALLAIVLAAIGAMLLWNAYTYRFGRAIARQGTVQVYTGTSFEELTQMLLDSGYIDHPERWQAMAQGHDLDTVRAGNYALRPGMSYRTMLMNFARGRQTPVRLTFNNIRTMDRLAGAISRYIEADSATMLKALSNPETIRQYGFTAATFPALFIPNTYEVYWTLTPQEFVERMRVEHDRFWNEERLAQAKVLGFTPAEVATLASIVIEETKFRGEMITVAGVYINRLRRGMPLQADPTVKFAMGDPTIKRVLRKHLKYDSPYNTYLYTGLPPGPICVPSIAAIDAVLEYSDLTKQHAYYYFCAKADFSGRHAFARTLEEHNRNAAAYAAELNRRGIR